MFRLCGKCRSALMETIIILIEGRFIYRLLMIHACSALVKAVKKVV